MYTVWYSTESLARYIIKHTSLAKEERSGNLKMKKLYESDANNSANFHRMPTHLKKILYLDAPDIIIELDSHPVLSLEVSSEAGTGHNAFQRFARIAAAVENGVPAFYVYPDAGFVYRQNNPGGRWDKINPLIFDALERAMRIYEIPAMLYYFPTYLRSGNTNFPRSCKGLMYDPDFPSLPKAAEPEMRKLFEAINETLSHYSRTHSFDGLLVRPMMQDRRDWMSQERHLRAAGEPARIWSPETSTRIVPTRSVLDYLRKFAGRNYEFGDLMPSRENTLVYNPDADFRGDPYPGALAALDYLKCRQGKTYEERHTNLVMAWGQMSLSQRGKIQISGGRGKSIDQFVNSVRSTYRESGKILLNKTYRQLRGKEIPRYFMQVRFGSTFTKVKHIRVYSYFCDAILFNDGALWREG